MPHWNNALHTLLRLWLETHAVAANKHANTIVLHGCNHHCNLRNS